MSVPAPVKEMDGMTLRDFEYVLPPDRIAQEPVTPRDHSRLMVLQANHIEHRRFFQIGEFLRQGDTLVLNTTKVFPARLRGKKRSGGKAELLLLGAEQPDRWRALVRGATTRGTELVFPEGLTAKLEERRENGEWGVRFSQASVREYLNRQGEMPLPPYIKRSQKMLQDDERYQTVFAKAEGAVAAPTAGFHFTPELLDALKNQGVNVVEITLHVGWGTFRPVRVEEIDKHPMLPESYEVSPQAALQLNGARAEGRRVVAVGTTVVRTLESVYDEASAQYRDGAGETNLFITPGYRFRALDALLTNFHLPDATPLFLACAFYKHRHSAAEPFALRAAYETAIQEGYRFFSYGDAMLIL